MDAPARLILRTFDRLGLERLTEIDLASATSAGVSGTARGIVARLVEEGYLREIAGQYERTELGRLEASGPLDLALLTRPGCRLCEEALRQIEPLATKFRARLHVIDVDTDRALRERYGNDIPVVFLGGREVARHHVDPARLQPQLSRASQKS